MLNKTFVIIVIYILIFIGCTNGQANQENEIIKIAQQIPISEQNHQLVYPSGQTIKQRFLVPKDFYRKKIDKNSFAHYLRNLKLKPHNSLVKYYNGAEKPNNNVYDAVIDLQIGNKNLHQCADAVMRLRADYLWKNKLYNDIHFDFTNGMRVDYLEWMKGRRMVVNGNTTYWNNQNQPSNTYHDFWNYLELIFTYAGTLSLSKELKSVRLSNMKIGDVLIQGGSPGHAVIVVDMAIHKSNGKKIYLLAQSYMPAQELQILKNNQSRISPWYILDENSNITTPEWSFSTFDLKRFD